LPCPDFAVDKNIQIEERLSLAQNNFQDVYNKSFKDGQFICLEQTLKAWEPYIGALMENLPDDEARQFTDAILTKWARYRTGIMPEVFGRISNARKSNNKSPQIIIIDVNKTSNLLRNIDVFIDPVRQQTDYSEVKRMLWRNLIDKRHSAVPHKKTGRGVETAQSGELININGELSSVVHAIGFPAEGAEIVKGRTPPFTSNLGAIKDSSTKVTQSILTTLEWSGYAEEKQYQVPTELDKVFNDLVSAHVQRIGFKTQNKKRDVDRKILLQHIPAISKYFTKESNSLKTINYSVKQFEFIAWQEAWNKFTKKNITPLQLRAELELNVK
jgi:hypothetical protein